MKLQTAIISIVAILILTGVFSWGYGRSGNQVAGVSNVAQTSELSEAGLKAPKIFYDFGTISMRDGNVEKDFTIINPTGADIKLKTVSTSCMCTKAIIVRKDGSTKGPFGMPGMGFVPPANEVVKAGESLVIRAVYDPNAHGPAGIGMIGRFINLVDESGNSIRLEIKALVKP